MAVISESVSSRRDRVHDRGVRGAGRRMGRPRPRDAAPEPVPAARLAGRVVAPLRRRARSSPSRSPAATGGWPARSRWWCAGGPACAWRASWAAGPRSCPTSCSRRTPTRPSPGSCSSGWPPAGATSPTSTACARAAASPRRSARASALIQRIESPVLDLSAGWDAVYRDKTNAKKRNLHRRRRRQLGEQGELTVTVARELPELRPALEEAFTCTTCAGRAGRTDRASRRGRHALPARGLERLVGDRRRRGSRRCGSTARRSRSTTGSRSRAACTCTAWPSTPGSRAGRRGS